MTETPAQLTRRFIEEALNGRNLDVIDELIAQDYEELDPMPNQLPGRQGVRDVFQSLLHAFPDLHWEILEQICEGNKVVTRCVWTGTQENDLGGIAATGKRVELEEHHHRRMGKRHDGAEPVHERRSGDAATARAACAPHRLKHGHNGPSWRRLPRQFPGMDRLPVPEV